MQLLGRINNFISRHEKATVFGAMGFGVVAIIILLAVTFSRSVERPTTELAIVVAPSYYDANGELMEYEPGSVDAEIRIDGKLFRNGQYSVSAGSYRVEIGAEGFESFNTTLELKEDAPSVLYVALEPAEDNKDYYENHAHEESLLEIINAQ